MEHVDAYLLSQCGMTSEDIPDYSYRDGFDEGLSVEEVGDEALENAGALGE